MAVRLSERQLGPLQKRAHIEGITLSEAVRRTIDDWARGYSRTRQPTAAERDTFRQLAKAFGGRRRRHMK